MSDMEYSVDPSENSHIFGELIERLNLKHDVNFSDSAKYLLQALYSQILDETGHASVDRTPANLSDWLNEAFDQELARLSERNQERFETIMSNDGVREQLLNVLSKQVYHHLNSDSTDR